MSQNYIGVDLSRDWLDIHDPRRGGARIANTGASIRAWLAELGPADLPVFEATSGCDPRLIRLLGARGQPAHRVNPLFAWHFAQSLNLPKTDRVDAAMLARMGAERQLTANLYHTEARAGLAELNARRDQLKRMETQEKNRLGNSFSSTVKADIRASLRTLAARIARIEAEISACLAANPDLARTAALLQSIPGIGRVASITLLSTMPELGQCDRRGIASLGGLAPKARESGRWRGHRAIGAGRKSVRRVLYLAALNTLRHDSFASTKVARMRAEGRPGKVIAITLARKLLTVANAVIRDQKPFKTPT